MKWFLIIVLVAVIMLIATAVSGQYKEKCDFYGNLHKFLCQFKINVSFKKEKIIDFLNQIQPKKQFKIFIDDYKVYLNNNTLNFSKITLLDEEEKQDLINIVKNLGEFNTENELQQLEGFLLIIKEKHKNSIEDKNKICPILLKLSLLFSIGLAIILI